MRYKNFKPIISLVMALVLAFTAVALIVDFSTITAEADQITNLQNRIRQNQEEAARIQQNIRNLQGDASRARDLQRELQRQVDNTQAQINNAEALLREIEAEIVSVNNQIVQIEQDIENNTETFRRRMRAMYMTGNVTGLEIILGATDLEEFLMQTELMRNVARQDYDLLVEMRENLENVNNLREQTVARQAEAQNTRNMLANQRQNLRGQRDAAAAEVGQIQGTIGQQQAERDRIYREMNNQRREVERLIELQRQQNQGLIWHGTQFVWPVPSHHTVSSHFGMRWGRLHGGIDIAGPGINGRPVVAAADGIVVTSASGWNGGFGTLIVIDHGRSSTTNRTYDTWYAHLSSRSVSVGQRVTAGQVIGAVGNTGDSTGPHLHFEIRVNNQRVNPMNFFSR